jgi:hypothetical protein
MIMLFATNLAWFFAYGYQTKALATCQVDMREAWEAFDRMAARDATIIENAPPVPAHRKPKPATSDPTLEQRPRAIKLAPTEKPQVPPAPCAGAYSEKGGSNFGACETRDYSKSVQSGGGDGGSGAAGGDAGGSGGSGSGGAGGAGGSGSSGAGAGAGGCK